MHHFPVELWSRYILETIIGHIGRSLKIDKHTSLLNGASFVLVYVEIDLTWLLKHGFWVGDDGY